LSKSHQRARKGKSISIVTLGIDLAKNVFALDGVDATGTAVLVRPSVPRGKLLDVVAGLPPCVIGMEASSGSQEVQDLSVEVTQVVGALAGSPTSHQAP
jgi:hypothetical protein